MHAHDRTDPRGTLELGKRAKLLWRDHHTARARGAQAPYELLGHHRTEQPPAHNEGLERDSAVDAPDEVANALDEVEPTPVSMNAPSRTAK